MASLKERFKSGLKAMGAGVKQAGVMLVSGATAGGAAAAKAKKKKLRAGMMKATGQSKDQAAKIQQRVDIAAKRKAAGKSYKAVPKSAGFSMEMKERKKRGRNMSNRGDD